MGAVVAGYQASASDGTTAVSSLTVALPAEAAAGHLGLIWVANDNDTATAQFDNTTYKPAGWTLVNESGSATPDAHLALFYKVLDAADVSAGSVSVPAQSTMDMVAVCLVIDQYDAATLPMFVTADVNTADQTAYVLNVADPTVGDALVMACMAFDGADGSLSLTGTGWTGYAQVAAGTSANSVSLVWGTNLMASAGTTANPTISSAVADGRSGFSIWLAPGTDGPSAEPPAATGWTGQQAELVGAPFQSNTSVTSGAVTATMPVPAGVPVMVTAHAGAAPVMTCTDSAGNTYTLVGDVANTTGAVMETAVWVTDNPNGLAVDDTVTVARFDVDGTTPLAGGLAVTAARVDWCAADFVGAEVVEVYSDTAAAGASLNVVTHGDKDVVLLAVTSIVTQTYTETSPAVELAAPLSSGTGNPRSGQVLYLAPGSAGTHTIATTFGTSNAYAALAFALPHAPLYASTTTPAIVGDSLTEREGTTAAPPDRQAETTAVFTGGGFAGLGWYGDGGKPLEGTDSNGQTVEDSIDALVTSLGGVPPIWVIALGTNFGSLTATQFGDRMRAIVDYLNAAGASWIIWPELTFYSAANTNAATYNPVIATVAAEYGNVSVLELNTLLHTPHDDADWIYPTDSTHMTVQGYARRDAAILDAALALVDTEASTAATMSASTPLPTATLPGDSSNPAVLAAPSPLATAALAGDAANPAALAATAPRPTAVLPGSATNTATLTATTTPPTAVLTGMATNRATMATALEDFETTSRFTANNGTAFTLAPAAGVGGTQCLTAPTTAGYKQNWDPTRVTAPGDGTVYAGWVQTPGGYTNTGLSGLALVSSAGGQLGYQAVIDVRAGQKALQIRKDYSSTGASNGTLDGSAISSNTWYWLEVRWTATRAVEARLYTAPGGTLLDQATRPDDAYLTVAYLGVAAYSTSAWDALAYGPGATTPHVTVALADTATITGTLGAATPTTKASLAGSQTNPAALTAATPPAAATLTGASSNPATIAGTTPAATGTLAGTQVNAATLATTTPAATAALVDTTTIPATLAAITPTTTATFPGTSTNPATLTASPRAPTATITGQATNPAALAATTPHPTAAVAGTQRNGAALAATVPALSCAMVPANHAVQVAGSIGSRWAAATAGAPVPVGSTTTRWEGALT